MVLIEPGVTYPQLQPELARAGLKLSTPLLPRSNKSIITSLLEREPILTPRFQWSMLEPLRALEVVWGDGQKMTTGDAGGTDLLEEEWKKGFAQIVGSGPAQTDFYKVASAAQGSMGIVTWASIKCEILPQEHKMFLVGSDRLDSLIELCYEILRIRFGDELFLLNGWSLANILEKNPGAIKKLGSRLPPWLLAVGIAGRARFPAERVEYQTKDIADLARKHDLELLAEVAGISGQKLLEAILKPCSDPYWKLGYKGACQDIFFLTTLDKAPKFIQAMNSVAEAESYPTSEIGMYLQPVHQGASCHIEFNFPFQRDNSAELGRMQALFSKGSLEMLDQGAYYSRPYGLWSQLAFNRDFRTTQVLNKIKDIFDPNHIMNPGKLCF
jgi:FAD/FMN-containing dehydrogenase